MNYFQSPLGINHIPNFLRASTASGLRRLIARNNMRLKGFVQYIGQPTWNEKESKWYVWYYETEDFKGLEDVMQGGNE